MKMKKLLCLLLAALLLTGCAKNATADRQAMEAPRESYAPGIYDSEGDYYYTSDQSAAVAPETGSTNGGSYGKPTQQNAASAQKLIRTMNMEVETDNLDDLLAYLDSQISAMGGYLENKSVRNGSSSDTRRYRYANLKIRVPVERLDEMVEHISGKSNVVNYQETADDITLTYVATQSRVKALEVEQERLLELLNKAEDLSDLLQIEQRLTEVRTELENVASRLRLYNNLVDYGTVELQITEVQVFTIVEEETVWQRIGKGLSENWNGLCSGVTEIFVFLVSALPYLIPMAVAVTVAVLLIKKKKHRRHHPKPEAETE